MSEEALAVVEANAATLADIVGTAALDAPDTEPHEEVFVRITPDRISTPASNGERGQSSFCTADAAVLDRLSVTESVEALFPVRAVLDWLVLFDGEVRVSFDGRPSSAIASQLRISDDDREVTIECVTERAVFEAIELWLPDRFDGGTFLDAEGNPHPTHIETTAETLEQVVDAVEATAGVDHYALAVEDDTLRYEFDGDGVAVAGRLAGAVDGPAFDHRYGRGFRRVVRTLHGEVTLQTSPAGPLAIVQDRGPITLRYVIDPIGE